MRQAHEASEIRAATHRPRYRKPGLPNGSVRTFAGAVPVIFGSTVAPFSGAADESELGIRWDRCVVHVWGVEEIAGLPERLRAMPATEYLRRRAACRSIFRRVLGTRGAYQRAFFTLLRARARGATAAASG